MAKRLGVILGIILIMILSLTSINYAVNDSDGIWLGLRGRSNERETGTYTFNNKSIFKIVQYRNSTGTEEGNNATIYCLRAGKGFGSEAYENSIIKYTQYFDMKFPEEIEQPYRNELPTDEKTYSELVWLLDHLYIPAQTGASSEEIELANQSKQNLLDNAGVSEDSFLRDEVTYADEIEDILECIQQVAIWHFTNPGDEYYNESTDHLELKVDGESLSDKYSLDFADNEIDSIYRYLVQGAIDAVEGGYTYEDASAILDPLELDKNRAAVTIEGSNYIIGPYKLNKESNVEYEMNVKLMNGTTDITNAKILNNSKEEIQEGTTVTDKIASTIGNDFYISVPISSNISNFNIEVSVKFYETTQTFWSVGETSLTQNQPVVILSREEAEYKMKHELPIESPKFDLALRKYITSINGEPVNPSREPQITQEYLRGLATGTADFDNGTTSTKNHTKTPLLIENEDKIIYTIRIYNEGDLDGYAKKIVDYLPEGLELVDQSESTINTKYNWQVGESKGGKTQVYTNYLENELIPKFDKAPVDGTYELNYRDVQIECKIVKEPTQQDITFKNVAEIQEAEDVTGSTQDRDSTPGNLTDEQIKDYLPGTSEAGKGYEDDDDYEELIMLGKYFDLSLRKFITGVNNVAVTDREPQVDVSPLLAGQTTAIYNHTKNPVSVSAGDIVTYTIRVYNEGQVDGYVDEIVDHLPPELEFIIDDEINISNGWILDPADSTQRTIRTTKLSKENDVDNIIKAFNPETKEISYRDVQVRCKVKETAQTQKKITNIAEITEYSNDSNLVDRDNSKDVVLPSDEDLPNYKKNETNSEIEYIPEQ